MAPLRTFKRFRVRSGKRAHLEELLILLDVFRLLQLDGHVRHQLSDQAQNALHVRICADIHNVSEDASNVLLQRIALCVFFAFVLPVRTLSDTCPKEILSLIHSDISDNRPARMELGSLKQLPIAVWTTLSERP
jgi:hypothetical protein